MKSKIGMRAFSLLLAVMLISVVVPAAVSVDEITFVSGDVLGEVTLIERSPSLVQELRKNPDAEETIAAAIHNYPRVVYLTGWSDDDNERIKGIYERAKEYWEQEAGVRSWTQKDGRMWINEYNYRGINGLMHPGGMGVSSSGTNCQYLTSHLGQPIGGYPCWIEVGVAKFSEIFNGDPNEFVIFTVDSTLPEGDKFVSHGNFTNGNRDFNFEIYVSSVQYPQGYPYMLSWEGEVIRTGHVPFTRGNPDENHEYFAADSSSFTPVSTAYFWDSYLYNDQTAVWWNENLPEKTHYSQGSSPVMVAMYVPWWSQAYRIDSWIP
ncbi:MAG: hypothetical protein KO206_05750 [Methanomicrobiaceae archaeon]|nr:hypothetical protein [Methanomicrobiaceae archaeon]MDD5420255.1 hypothetical protein [Methanomicrobiaceae archaeon]